jgi:hypothetical protein
MWISRLFICAFEKEAQTITKPCNSQKTDKWGVHFHSLYCVCWGWGEWRRQRQKTIIPLLLRKIPSYVSKGRMVWRAVLSNSGWTHAGWVELQLVLGFMRSFQEASCFIGSNRTQNQDWKIEEIPSSQTLNPRESGHVVLVCLSLMTPSSSIEDITFIS